MNKRVGAWVLAVWWAVAAWAGEGAPVAEWTAGGGTKEVALDRTIRVIEIECTEGPVTVAEVVVREGEAESTVGVHRAFRSGETQDIDLGHERQVTGLEIRDSGPGRYLIRVQ